MLSKGLTWVDILSTQVQKGVETQQKRRSRVLRADLIPLWLSGISTKSVKPEAQETIEELQEKAGRILWEAFQEGGLTSNPIFDNLYL